jgi:hypothetical protein
MLFALAYLLPSTGGRGLEMDEGAVVVYPALVLDGAVPHRDFSTFYGPGNLWAVAGAFAVFGESIETERAVGMAYRLVIVLALFLLGLRIAGVLGGAFAAVLAAVMMAPEVVWAWATYGGLALGLLGLAIVAMGVRARPARETGALVAGGVLCGLAVLVRPDLAPAVFLGALPLLVLASPRSRVGFAGGAVAALGLLLVHLAIVGPERIARVVTDVVASGPGRELPLPGVSEYPGNLLALSSALTVGLLLAGVVLWRRHADPVVSRTLVGLGVFSLAFMPYAFSRPDQFHIRPVALVPACLAPAAAFVLVRAFVGRGRVRHVAVVAVAFTCAVAVVEYGHLTFDQIQNARDFRDAYRGFEDGNTREARRAVIARAKAVTRPGETLFVGPQDLRRTNYGPTYMYFELRELRPASYYMEMNPGSANAEDSGLADELRRADWLILTSEWDDVDEPNESREYGSPEPNEVVRDDFCLRFERGQYRLYERCDRAA